MAYTEADLLEIQERISKNRKVNARNKPKSKVKREIKPEHKDLQVVASPTAHNGNLAIQEITIPIRFPSLNDYTNANRGNKYGGAGMKKEYTDAVTLFCKQVKLNTVEKPCRIGFTWYDNAMRDPDNIAFAKKFILDGIVTAGVLPNDTWRWIKGFSDDFVKCKKVDAKVVVTIKEV